MGVESGRRARRKRAVTISLTRRESWRGVRLGCWRGKRYWRREPFSNDKLLIMNDKLSLSSSFSTACFFRRATSRSGMQPWVSDQRTMSAAMASSLTVFAALLVRRIARERISSLMPEFQRSSPRDLRAAFSWEKVLVGGTRPSLAQLPYRLLIMSRYCWAVV